MTNIREVVETYIKRVKELSEHVRGNEQATKQSLIGPFFTMLGYDLTDPRECLPEYKADFGKDRSTKPIDWGFKHSGNFAFFVEAKEVGKKLLGYDEQLGDYFAKEPNVKLGILTNGATWRFFTDLVNANVMDKEPFAKWDILADETPPFDVITLLQKEKFNPELIRTFAQSQRNQNLLLTELTRLLEPPSSEFTKLAIANLESRNLTQAVVEGWKPIVANAIQDWAKQRTLTAVLSVPAPRESEPEATGGRIETTKEELDAFDTIKRLLGAERPIGWEDSVAYFKVHLAEKRTWVFARLYMNRRNPVLAVQLPAETVMPMVPGRPVTSSAGWTSVSLESPSQIGDLAELLQTAYAAVKKGRVNSPTDAIG